MNGESARNGAVNDGLGILVKAAQAGDHAAFDRILALFQDRAVGYGYSLLGDVAHAEDAAQDAFLTAFQELPKLVAPAAFPSWFRRIVFKSCDRIRRRKAFSSIPLEDAKEIACQDAGPFERIEIMDAKKQIREAIEALPESERTAIAMFYVGEHSQAEIADFLEVPVTTVKKRLQRARARLHEELLPLVRETLSEFAPSQDARFAEVSRLLRQIDEGLRKESRIKAAYLAHFGIGEGFGPEDDAWSSINVHVVIDDTHLDEFGMARLEFAANFGKPLLWVEAPQNAPPHGYYLMTLYDGEAGPYQVDWYWHRLSSAVIPADTRVLFDRAELPTSENPTPWGYLTEDQIPVVLRQSQAARTESEAWSEEARNMGSLFWAMVLISARHIARRPGDRRLPFGGMLLNLLRDLRVHLGEASSVPDAEDPSLPDLDAKLNRLRRLGGEMERLLSEAALRGANVPSAAPKRLEKFLQLVEKSVKV